MVTLAYGFLAMLALACLTWIVSVWRRDVSIVDSIWSLMFLAAASVYASAAPQDSLRIQIILGLLLLWALRLSVYLTWRNWGEGEDRRYQAIRAKYEPHFAIKSLAIIFGFQAVLAWIIALPLWPALTIQTAITPWDVAAMLLWLTGMTFETVGDWQLARFKADPANKGKVMDRGLWYYTRHPNYFGECLIWWGFFAFALSAGAWWTILSPLLLTWLLLKFSGVVMLEGSIVERRPAYREYIARTNAFVPGRPKKTARNAAMEGHPQ
jgi:steroid 5-alpha reductase family enzyme